MPMIGKDGAVKKKRLPRTIAKSGKKAQRTFATAHDSALEQYDDEERAYRVGFAALKAKYEKVGSRWKRKPQATSSGNQTGGVDADATKEHLYELAQELDIEGRSTMSKDELLEALRKASS